MKKIAVIGSANIDLILSTDRFPAAGETVLGKDYQTTFGGKGSNQAIAINRLGGDVKFFVRLGSDNYGQQMAANFEKEKLATAISWSEMRSGFATVINFDHDNRIMVFSGCNMESTPAYEDKIIAQLNDFDLILLQCEIAPSLNFAIAKWAHNEGKTVILNPAPVDKFEPRILPFIDYLIPNDTEAALISKQNPAPSTKIITTKGSLGATFVENGQEHLVPSLKNLNVVDTTGAGDAFVGGFVFGLSNDYPLKKCLQIGNIVGGKNTEALGATTGLIDRATLESEIS
ncbi:ribokinase [Xylocopilactobacillus apicola]|uniref:Ribokinase n=1 Tax=Xylocopilactobacillus apicola TaxID=2932184 RepID=A0AAU9CZA8_9LACO|nr:ribokinase [Xylocopilactobacillus apicola]BDR59362.1 ribokinase [Xylocopilactobacillus apicola]